MLNLPTAESNRATDVVPGSLQSKQNKIKQNKKAALSPHWNRHLLWIYMSSLPMMLLQKPPSVNLQDALFNMMVFYPQALLLISELILHKWSIMIGSCLWNLLILSFSPSSWSCWVTKWNGLCRFSNSTSWLATPCRAGAVSSRTRCML